MTYLKRLARAGKIMKFQKEETVFKQGDRGLEMFVVLKGRVSISQEIDGSFRPLTQLRQGDVFGVTSLIQGKPRSGTAVAVGEENYLAAINKESLRRAVSEDGEFAWKMILGLSSRMHDLKKKITLDLPKEEAIEQILEDIKEEKEEEAEKPEEKLAEVQYDDDLNSEIIDNKEKTYTKDAACPVCQAVIKVIGERTSKLILCSTDTDLRKRFEDYEQLHFLIWSCSNCGYSNTRADFEKLDAAKAKILANSKESRLNRINQGPRTIKKIINDYHLAIECAILVGDPKNKIGSLWLSLGWLFEDIQEQEKAQETWSKALECFEMGYFDDRRLAPERQQKTAYIIGELYRKLGKYDKAREFYLKGILKSGDPKINSLATDQILMLKEILKEGV